MDDPITEREVKNNREIPLINDGETKPKKMTLEEIDAVIKHRPKRKAPGRDGIKNECLKNAKENIRKKIVDIAHRVFKHLYFPQK